MGDRGNIVLRYNSSTTPADIFLYTHWTGSCLGATVRTALARRERWDDDSYLARIIFQTLLGDDTTELGFGLSPSVCDNEHDFLVVDFDEQCIHRCPSARDKAPGDRAESWTFEQFASLPVSDPVLTDWP